MFGLASRETVVQDVSQGDVSKKSDFIRAEHLNAQINELTAWLLNSKNTTRQSVNLKHLELDEINQRLLKLETKQASTTPQKKSYKTKKVVSS